MNGSKEGSGVTCLTSTISGSGTKEGRFRGTGILDLGGDRLGVFTGAITRRSSNGGVRSFTLTDTVGGLTSCGKGDVVRAVRARNVFNCESKKGGARCGGGTRCDVTTILGTVAKKGSFSGNTVE